MTNCNAFERCKWLKLLGKVMVLVVLGFVVLSIWAVMDVYGPFLVQNTSETQWSSFLIVTIFLGLVGMLLWSYFVAVITEPGRVPLGWTPFTDEEEASDELERISSQRGSTERLAGSSRPRYCRKCRAWKPPRTHHDSITGRCVLKMDHYCVWIINCVGLLNYKAFLLFLLYSCLACGLASALLLGAFIRFLVDGRDEGTPPAVVFIAFVVDVAFVLCLLGFLGMHARLVAVNCTTIEMYEKRRVDQWPYDRGFVSNFQDVFGYRVVRWFMPHYTEEEKEELLEGILTRRHGMAFEHLKMTQLAAEL